MSRRDPESLRETTRDIDSLDPRKDYSSSGQPALSSIQAAFFVRVASIFDIFKYPGTRYAYSSV